MIINSKTPANFLHEVKERGVDAAVKQYLHKLDDLLNREQVDEIDSNRRPYLSFSIIRARRYLLRYLCNRPTNKKTIHLSKDHVNILFILYAGLGDIVINRNYIMHFLSYYENEPIRCYVVSDKDINTINSLIDSDSITVLELKEEPVFKSFDIIVRMIRYPVVLSFKEEVLKGKSSRMMDYVSQNMSFQKEYGEIIDNHPFLDYLGEERCISEGKKRSDQPDFNNLFCGMGIYTISYSLSSLNKFPLSSIFITVNRDSGFQEDIKLWPVEYYISLINHIKRDFPSIQLVLVGTNADERLRAEVDLDLVGETNMDELKALLGEAILHIASEGFTVHLRHFVSNKPSVVFFGPTPMSFYGYEENLNMSPDINCWCEWKCRDWYKGCMNGKRSCLESISVEKVYPLIYKQLSDLLRRGQSKV